MPAVTSDKRSGSPGGGVRQTQRLETRARLFDAAVAEIGRSGLAGADVSAIAAAAGVARGTFYFHFPTKEHVVAELEQTEEAKIVEKLSAATTSSLPSVLTDLVQHVLAAEHRLGPVLFQEMLALHFSSTRPLDVALGEHPLVLFVIAALTNAQAAGRVTPDADADKLGVIFMAGLFALLAIAPPAARTELLDHYVKTFTKGIETR